MPAVLLWVNGVATAANVRRIKESGNGILHEVGIAEILIAVRVMPRIEMLRAMVAAMLEIG